MAFFIVPQMQKRIQSKGARTVGCFSFLGWIFLKENQDPNFGILAKDFLLQIIENRTKNRRVHRLQLCFAAFCLTQLCGLGIQ